MVTIVSTSKTRCLHCKSSQLINEVLFSFSNFKLKYLVFYAQVRKISFKKDTERILQKFYKRRTQQDISNRTGIVLTHFIMIQMQPNFLRKSVPLWSDLFKNQHRFNTVNRGFSRGYLSPI